MSDNIERDEDQDGLSQFPSAANPLTGVIDPDLARANPDLLAQLNSRGLPGPVADKPPTPGPMAATPTEPPDEPSKSAVTAGALGGAATSPPSVTDYGMQGLASLSKNADMATAAAGEVPTSNTDVARLTAQREKLGTPAPLYDPQTGKMLSQTKEYDPATGQEISVNPKPGAGTRIWRGVRGGLTGLLEGGIRGGLLGAIDPTKVGVDAYGAPSGAYQKAETQREGELGATDKSLGDTMANWKQAVDAAKAKAGEFRSNAGLGKDLTTGATGMENAATDAVKAKTDQQKADQESPTAKLKLSQDEFTQRQGEAANLKLSGVNKLAYILNGKIFDPQQPNEAEFNAAAAARALVVFRAQHNGQDPQTLEDFNAIQAAARGTLAGQSGNKEADTNLRAAVNSANSRLKDLQDIQKTMSYAPKADKDAIQGKIDTAQREYDQLQSQLATAATPSAAPAPGPAAANTPPQPPPAPRSIPTPQSNPIGTPLLVNGVQHMIVGYNQKTKKPILDPNPISAARGQ